MDVASQRPTIRPSVNQTVRSSSGRPGVHRQQRKSLAHVGNHPREHPAVDAGGGLPRGLLPGRLEKRRLCPYPARWVECTDEDLLELLDRAEPVPPLKLHAGWQPIVPVASASRPPLEDAPSRYRFDVTDLQVVRTFRYPGGAVWTLRMISHPDDGGAPKLRFTAGERSIDLRTWPKAWPDYPDERLVELLRRAAPRPTTKGPQPGTPHRRWNDKPETSSG
jgi:hypothetical protein